MDLGYFNIDSDPLPLAPSLSGSPQYKITPNISVDSIITISSAPEYWAIIKEASGGKVAYLLDLRANTPECLKNGSKRIDAFIKQQCQDSWKGNTGSWKTAVNVPALDNVQCRRSTLYCNGCYTCNCSETDFLEGFQRWDQENQTLTDILAQVFERHKLEAASFVAQTISWYRSIQQAKCECGGHTVLREYIQVREGCSKWYVGCSKLGGRHRNVDKHFFRAIPNEIDIKILTRLFEKKPLYKFSRPNETPEIYKDIEPLLVPCTNIVHPSLISPSRECEFIHFGAGEFFAGHLRQQYCPAKLTIFVPLDNTDFRAIVIPENLLPHSHPTFPPHKVPHDAKEAYRRCIQAFGTLGATVLKVDHAPSTRAILGGKIPEEVHPSLCNGRKRRQIIQEEKSIDFPRGSGLDGVWNEFMKQRKELEPRERYIQSFITYGSDIHVIITLHHHLVAFILDAQWIMVDTTFKVVHGCTNEFKVVIWSNALNRRIVIGRVWANSSTRETFFHVWSGLWEGFKVILNREINFKAFFSESSLLGVIGDSEGPQAQGFGDMVVHRRLYATYPSEKHIFGSNDVLCYLWKTCTVHFDRGVLNMKDTLTQAELEYLRSLPRLENMMAVAKYRQYCEELSSRNKKVRDWWAHKKAYPWLIPSLNCSESRMCPTDFKLLPNSTNQMEGSHATDNRMTSTNLSLLEAILSAKQADEHIARVLKVSQSSQVMINKHNSIKKRFSIQGKRKETARSKRDQNSATKAEEESLKAQRKEINERLRSLRQSKKPSQPSTTPTERSTENLLGKRKASVLDEDLLDAAASSEQSLSHQSLIMPETMDINQLSTNSDPSIYNPQQPWTLSSSVTSPSTQWPQFFPNMKFNFDA